MWLAPLATRGSEEMGAVFFFGEIEASGSPQYAVW